MLQSDTDADIVNRVSKLRLCFHCTMQGRDVNHNLLRAVGSSAPFHKCTVSQRQMSV